MVMVKPIKSFCEVKGNKAARAPRVLKIFKQARPQVGEEMVGAAPLLATKLILSHIRGDLAPGQLKEEGLQDF